MTTTCQTSDEDDEGGGDRQPPRSGSRRDLQPVADDRSAAACVRRRVGEMAPDLARRSATRPPRRGRRWSAAGAGRPRCPPRRGPGRGDRTTTRSATRIASGMLWVTMTIVGAARSQRRSSSRSNRSRVSASSALNGSSRSRTSGSSASARARATRWRIPPDSSDGRAVVDGGVEADELDQRGEPRRAPFGGPAGELERVGDVVRGRPPRQQPRLLEDQPDRGSGPVIGAPSSAPSPPVGREQAGDDAQERRLAAAVRADEGDDPAARDVEIDARRGPAAGAPSRRSGTRTSGRAARWRRHRAGRAGRRRASRRGRGHAAPSPSGRRIGAVAG